MDLMKLAAQIFLNKLGNQGGGLNSNLVTAALTQLLPTSGGGDLDLGALLEKMNVGGLSGLAASFLGDGANDSMSASNILGMFGDANISSFASQLGIEKDEASEGLSNMIPELIDQNSKGGSLLAGSGASLVGSLASQFFK